MDVSARAEIEAHIRSAAETVAQRLRRRSILVRGVRVKLKRSDFRVLTRQRALNEPTDVAAELFRVGKMLLDEFGDAGPFRLIGLGVYDFVQADKLPQLMLTNETTSRARRLEKTLDDLADRFGAGVVQRAADLIADRGMGVAANLDFLARDTESDAD